MSEQFINKLTQENNEQYHIVEAIYNYTNQDEKRTTELVTHFVYNVCTGCQTMEQVAEQLKEMGNYENLSIDDIIAIELSKHTYIKANNDYIQLIGKQMTKKIYHTYSQDTDMTFILEDATEEETIISTEVKGFYFGVPNEEVTKQFYGKLKAEF